MSRAYQCPDCGDVTEDEVCRCLTREDWHKIGEGFAEIGRRMSAPRPVEREPEPDWLQGRPEICPYDVDGGGGAP